MKTALIFLPALAALGAATPTNDKREELEQQLFPYPWNLGLPSAVIPQLQNSGINPSLVQPDRGNSQCVQCVNDCSRGADAFNFACKVLKCGIQVIFTYNQSLDSGGILI